MRLTKDEIVRSGDAAPLELFRQGMRARYTQEKYTRTLRQILCKYFEDILEGEFEERVAQLVRHGRDDPEWTRDLLLNLSRKLRERTTLPTDDPDYLNPTSFGNYFKPIKKLFDMNDVAIPWKRLYATYPELDNMPESRGWSRDEISMMLKHARDPMERALVLVLSSSGVRIGGIDLNWEDLVPVYSVNDKLVLDPGADACEVACAMLQVYRGSAANYMAFITPEAYESLKVYGLTWADCMGRQPNPKDPIFLATRGIPKRASMQSVKKRLTRMVKHARLRPPVDGKPRRHNVPLANGFRRFYNKTCKEALSSDSPLASLIKKEFMMGHRGMISLDQNYFKTSVLELAQEYIGVVPDLSIEDSVRLKRSNTQMSANIRVLEDRDAKITSLEKKVGEMEDMRVGMLDMDRRLKESDGMGAVREDVNSLKSLIKTLEKIHRANIEEVRADQSKAMGELKATKDREISELKDMIGTLAERAGAKNPLSKYDVKTRRKTRN